MLVQSNLVRLAAIACVVSLPLGADAQGIQAPSSGAAKPVISDFSACTPLAADYPTASLRAFATGRTVVRLSIGPDGRLAGRHVIRSAGATREHKLLDRLVITKLSECQFTPGTDENGKPVYATVDVEYVWTIDGAPFRTQHPYFVDLSLCIPQFSDISDLEFSARTEGVANLVFSIGGDSRAKSGRVASASGESVANAALDQIALSRLMSCRFVQALANSEVNVGYLWPTLFGNHGVELRYSDVRRVSEGPSPPVAVSPIPAPRPTPRPAPQPNPEPAPSRAKALSSGSGFVVAPGRAITNHHLIDECSAVTVRFGDEDVRAEVLDSNRSNDLALLRLARPVGTPASVRTSAALGEDVTVAGFPLRGLLGSDLIVTSGQVNATAGLGNDPTVLQFSAPVQPGNSGGPLIDRAGAVVGVVFSKLNVERLARVTGDLAQNVNFAVKPELLRLFLEANRVQYKSAGLGPRLDGVQIADRARNFTVQVLCEAR